MCGSQAPAESFGGVRVASVSWPQSDFWCAPSFPESTLLMVQTAFVSRWSFYIVLLLLYTAIVTPVEVAFLTTSLDALFVFNRVVDVSFLVVRARRPRQSKGA